MLEPLISYLDWMASLELIWLSHRTLSMAERFSESWVCSWRYNNTHDRTSEFGLATHFVPQGRLPTLLAALSSLADSSPEAINRTIEEHSAEISPEDPSGAFGGERRKVLDACFSHNRVESIIKDLEDVASSTGSQAQWAQETLDAMLARSPTSLRVALQAVRRGKHKELADALQMEMGIATAFCVSVFINLIPANQYSDF
jgi:3-hydroxyisobutyryl-CoA hydrolase